MYGVCATVRRKIMHNMAPIKTFFALHIFVGIEILSFSRFITVALAVHV